VPVRKIITSGGVTNPKKAILASFKKIETVYRSLPKIINC